MSGSDTVFRRAVVGDLPAIVALLANDEPGHLREEPGLPLAREYLAVFEAIGADRNQFLAVACDGEDVVGTLQITFIPGIARKGAWRGQIEAVRVDENYRGTGPGQCMLEWAIGQCRERGCTLVQLTTDKTRTDAHRFYDKLGFIASHEGYKLALR